MTTHSGYHEDMPSPPVDTGLDAFSGANMTPGGGSAAATVPRSEAVDWSVTDYKSEYPNSSTSVGLTLCSRTVRTRSCMIVGD